MNRAKRAEGMERDVLTALAHAVRARAAYEELKMARLHLKYAERLASLSPERAERIRESARRHYEALTAEASRKFRESIREIRNILEKYGREERKEFLKALSAYLGPAVYKALPDRPYLLVKAADPMRIVKRLSHELYDVLAKAEEAYRIYRRLEKYLAKSAKAPPSPAPDYSIAMFIEGGAKYRRRVVEEAVAELSYHWLRARAGLPLKVDVTSIAYWHREKQVKLPPEAVKALKKLEAYRKARTLVEGGVEPAPLDVVKARLESDVFAIVAASKATPIAKELGEVAAALAFHWMTGKLKLPALVIQWIREERPEDWAKAKEAVEAFKRGDADAAKRLVALNAEEALARFKAAASKLVEEAVSIAKFSPGAYQRVKEIAEDLSRRGPLEKYLSAKIAEALKRVEPLRAPDAEAFTRLPEPVRDGLNQLVRNLEERMLREGYFDAVVKPFSRLFGEGIDDPREIAERAATKLRELWRVDLRDGEVYVTGYRQRAEEAYAKALRELEELARAPLAEVGGRAERVFDALAEALSYLVEDKFIRMVRNREAEAFDGDELAKITLDVVKEVLGVEAGELAAEAIARALGRWAEIGAREYPAWLEQGRLPDTIDLAVVFKAEEHVDLLSRRLQVITAAGGEKGGGWKVYAFAFHPALRDVVERARSVVADMLSKGKDAPSHIGIAPVEFVFTVANAWITDEGIATSRLGREFEDKLQKAFEYVITPPRPGEYKQPVDYKEIRRYDVYLAVRADPRLRIFAEMYGDEWWKAVEAAAGYKLGEMLMRQLREEYGKRGGRRELLWEWEPGASGYDVVGLLYYLTEGEIKEAEAARAYRMLEELKAYLKWLASPAQLVPKADPHKWREDNELFQAAVRIYAAVTGKKLEEVWQEAVERLRAIQPPGVKQELKEEQRGAQRPPAEAAEREKPAEKAEEKQAPSYKEAKAAEKPGEGMKGKAAERPGERAEERGRAAERAEDGAKRPLEKAVERPSERAEGAGQRPLKAEAAGLIPPSKTDLSAVTWLVGVLGRREMGREEAEALRRAVRKAVERVKAKYGPRLYKTGGEALAELADRAAEEAYTLAATAAESPEAVRYMLLLLENAEGPVFGLVPKSPLEADAARVFAKVAEYVRRAEAEFGAGLLVWNYARAVAEAVLREAERVWEDALRGIATVEQAVKAAVIAAAGVAGALAVHDGLYSTAVISATAAAVILAREGAFERAVEYVKKAAEAAYEAAREIFEKARIALEKLYQLFVEAVARVLDYIRAHWFIMAATAAGLIGWAFAQQLDYTLWQDHVAKFAPLIAGVPAFKEFKTALSDSDPVLKAAEEALKYRSEDAVERLFEEAKRAVGQSSKPWSDLRKVARDVERYGRRVVRPEHAAVAWALLEAGLRELGDVRNKALSALREAAEKITKGEEAEIPVKEVAEFVRRARNVAHRLELLFEDLVKNAEKRSDGEMRRAFAVTELAGELAEAATMRYGKLGDATLADKVIAFFVSLAEGTAWSRVVLNAAERGETYGALIKTPGTASRYYGAGKEKTEGEEERLGAAITRLAYWLAERGVDKAVVRRDGDVVKVVVNGETVAEVKAKAVKEEKNIVFVAWGKWVEEEGKKAAELVAKIEPSKAEEVHIYALLTTDGSYEAEGEVKAGTTSVLQAALYRRFGMEIIRREMGNLTEDGLKPQLAAKLYKERGGEKVVGMIRRDLEEGLEILLNNANLREELKERALKLLSEMKISVQGADEETGEGKQRIEEVRKKIEERIEKFLTELRLGENGAVCLVNCQSGEQTLTFKHEPYARVIAPLVHYIALDASEEEDAKFLAYAVLFDGTVNTSEASLTLGTFRVEEATKRLPLDVYDKIALYITLAAKYGVGIKRVYVREGEATLYFDREYAAGIFSLVWTELSRLWSFGVENGLYADHIFNKLNHIRRYVEDYANKLKIEYELYSLPGVDPWVEVRFKDERGK